MPPKPRFDRAAMQQGLKKRHDDSRASKDQGALDWESYFTTPSGVSLWSPKKSKEGETHYFDILPFYVGPNYPYIKTKSGDWVKLAEGEVTYVLDIWTHKNVGEDNATVVCPKTSYKLRCPECEHMKELLDNAGDDKDKRKKIFSEKAPKRRVMYNVIVRDGGKEEEKGVQILEISHWFMEKELQERAEATRTRGPIYYAHSDEGKTIKFKMIDKGDGNLDVTGYDFEDRTVPITDEQLMSVVTLDSLVKVYDYDKLYEMYWREKPDDKGHTESQEVFDDGTLESSDDQITVDGKTESLSGGNVSEASSSEEGCPYGNDGLVFGENHLEFDVCEGCPNEPLCREEKARLKKAQEQTASPSPKKRPVRIQR